MSSNKEEQAERRRVLLQDVRRDKYQSDTMHQRAITEMGEEYQGRFSKLRTEQQIIGTTPIAYPTLPKSSPWSSPLPCEEPLVDQTDCGDTYIGEPLGTPAEIEATSARELPITEARTLGRGFAYAPGPTIKAPTRDGRAPTFKRRI